MEGTPAEETHPTSPSKRAKTDTDDAPGKGSGHTFQDTAMLAHIYLDIWFLKERFPAGVMARAYAFAAASTQVLTVPADSEVVAYHAFEWATAWWSYSHSNPEAYAGDLGKHRPSVYTRSLVIATKFTAILSDPKITEKALAIVNFARKRTKDCAKTALALSRHMCVLNTHFTTPGALLKSLENPRIHKDALSGFQDMGWSGRDFWWTTQDRNTSLDEGVTHEDVARECTEGGGSLSPVCLGDPGGRPAPKSEVEPKRRRAEQEHTTGSGQDRGGKQRRHDGQRGRTPFPYLSSESDVPPAPHDLKVASH